MAHSIWTKVRLQTCRLKSVNAVLLNLDTGKKKEIHRTRSKEVERKENSLVILYSEKFWLTPPGPFEIAVTIELTYKVLEDIDILVLNGTLDDLLRPACDMVSYVISSLTLQMSSRRVPVILPPYYAMDTGDKGGIEGADSSTTDETTNISLEEKTTKASKSRRKAKDLTVR